MHQSEGESITHYLARLKAQATFCDFLVTCSSTTCVERVSYADDMISGQMIAGLFNTDHQSRVMAEAATFTTLQQKFHKLISLETTDQSTSHLHSQPQPVLSAAHKSVYKQSQRNTEETRLRERKHDLVNVKPCNGCGKHLTQAISQ